MVCVFQILMCHPDDFQEDKHQEEQSCLRKRFEPADGIKINVNKRVVKIEKR